MSRENIKGEIGMDFMKNVKAELNNEKTLTTNLAVAYETAGDELLDFNFKITNLRSCEESEIISNFKKIFYKDKLLAIKYLFYVGDIRQGLGERRIFKTCMKWVSKYHPEDAIKVVRLIPEYSRWDILISLIDNSSIKTEVVSLIRNQLVEDESNRRLGKPVSLLAKWMPSENTSSISTRNLARLLMGELHMSPRNYRKTLSGLRAYLDVVEVKMSNKDWDKINYSAVPSLANLRYSGAFLERDTERRLEYLDSLKKGVTKINAGVLQPHEIVFKYCKGFDSWYSNRGVRYDESLEQLWKALPDIVTKNTLVVRDGSGSMYTTVSQSGKTRAIDVATALAIYCSEHTTSEFKNKFITFSSRPRIVELAHCKSLAEKIDHCFNETEMSNTNIYKTMMLVLDTAVNHKMKQEDLPDNILIISDMQFDGRRFNLSNTLFEEIQEEFKKHGYKMPRLCFWNLDPYNHKTIPLQKNEMGLILCSGFSINNLKMFMSGEFDPLKVLLETINSKRYEMVEEALVA